MKRIYSCLLVLVSIPLFLLTGCKEEIVSSDPSLTLRFSCDSLCFDTVFTEAGSSTLAMMVYNPNRNAVKISRVTLQTSYFQVNLDGENDLNRLTNIIVNGKDSLYLFVRVFIPELSENNPVLITDTLRFYVNSNEQSIPLQAYGQNVHLWHTKERHRIIDGSFTFLNDKPYLIFDTLIITGKAILPEGTTLYLHSATNLLFYGGIAARGTADKPVRIAGDRLDKLFEHVPYRVASGQWGGVYLIQPKNTLQHDDTLNYIDILSGNVGLFCRSEQTDPMPHITMSNARIHNHALYGLVLQNVNADVWNTEISNCASYCVYLDGGKHVLTHNTIASFFGWPYTNLNIHNTTRSDVAAVYINNLSKPSPTEVHLRNCIITGARQNNLVLATPLPEYYTGEFYGNYLKADTIRTPNCHDNVYAADNDTVFKNTYYRYKEYVYYDFRLDSISPARSIGDSLIAEQSPFRQDRLGINRNGKKPDAGCYEWQP